MIDLAGMKDTFYAALRDRVAAGNAGRTVVVRGVVRPGVGSDRERAAGRGGGRDCAGGLLLRALDRG